MRFLHSIVVFYFQQKVAFFKVAILVTLLVQVCIRIEARDGHSPWASPCTKQSLCVAACVASPRRRLPACSKRPAWPVPSLPTLSLLCSRSSPQLLPTPPPHPVLVILLTLMSHPLTVLSGFMALLNECRRLPFNESTTP